MSDSPPRGPVPTTTIIFFVGGVTLTEARIVYEQCKDSSHSVYIGGSHILTPARFLKDVSFLDEL